MNKALVIIDIQNDYFPGGKNELVNSTGASLKAKELLETFRQKNLPVIHIQHLSVRPGSAFFVPNTTGAEIHANVYPQASETVITKNYPNSFRETGLQNHLQQQEIKHLVVAGMMSHMCVDATVRAAKDLGYDITVAADACATKNLSIQGKEMEASDVHHAFMAALNYFYADVKSTAELIEQL
ncbi:cysteine hydrolase family protein [Flavisolibacter nicotianae]|uniref:cysteine hydrolase family protein n=1 Tax=Flavisolibacter nicotianae TaxID=2364882 RepID=UPI000EAE884F|nr:cysteine hydrolase family protein [Flavisolibacter nicotianae]